MYDKTKIKQLLQSDARFAIRFITDNNPASALAVLSANGYEKPKGVSEADFIENTLWTLLNTKKAECIAIISQISYDNTENAPEYTRGFYDYFALNQPASTVTAAQKFTLDALFGGLGAGLQTYSGISLAGDQMNTYGTATTAQQQAALAAQEKEKARIRNNWIIGGLIGLVVVAGILIFAFTGKDKNKTKE